MKGDSCDEGAASERHLQIDGMRVGGQTKDITHTTAALARHAYVVSSQVLPQSHHLRMAVQALEDLLSSSLECTGFEEYLARLSSGGGGSSCTTVWQSGTVAYHCLTCPTTPASAICISCSRAASCSERPPGSRPGSPGPQSRPHSSLRPAGVAASGWSQRKSCCSMLAARLSRAASSPFMLSSSISAAAASSSHSPLMGVMKSLAGCQ